MVVWCVSVCVFFGTFHLDPLDIFCLVFLELHTARPMYMYMPRARLCVRPGALFKKPATLLNGVVMSRGLFTSQESDS